MPQFEVVEINLRGQVASMPVILVGQPHWAPTDFEQSSSGFRLEDSNLAKPWIERYLLKAEEFSCNAVVLPELSVPQDQIDFIVEWSRNRNCLIVAGTHYEYEKEKRYSVSPIIYRGNIHNQRKIRLSPVELSPLRSRDSIQSGNQIFIFRESPIGNFCNLICADYLDTELRKSVLANKIDVLSISAFQKDSRRYHRQLDIEVDDHEQGLYCLYSNTLVDGISDGESAVFGVIDKKLYGDDLGNAGHLHKNYDNLVLRGHDKHYLVFSFDLAHKTPPARHTYHTRPNIELLEGSKFEQKEAFASVRTDQRPKQEDSLYNKFPIKEQILSLLARHGYDDPEWVKAFSSMIFLDRLATLLGHNESHDLLEMQNKFLSYFNIKADDSLVLSEERILVTPAENEKIYNAMREEDAIDPEYLRYPRLRADGVDIERMHHNYLCSVALGISSNKNSRIMTMIREMVIDYFFALKNNESKDPHGGWIPYRTPWITARILINLGRMGAEHFQNEARIKTSVQNALISLINRISNRGIWKSGAGKWVSDWEATALVLEAFLITDSDRRFETDIERVVLSALEKKAEWLPDVPDFGDEARSNDCLAAVLMCSVLLRLQERYLSKPILSVEGVDTFYRFLSDALKVISSDKRASTRQFCTIPQVACYCCEVVA